MSFFPQCVPENIMMASLLAVKSVIVKIKIFMDFMNEIINPPCKSLLATFFESNFQVCPKTVASSLRILARLKRTISQLFKLLFPLPLLLSPKKNCFKKRRGEPCGRSKGPTEVGGVCETEAALRLMWRTKMRTLMLLVAWTKLGSLDRSLRD